MDERMYSRIIIRAAKIRIFDGLWGMENRTLELHPTLSVFLPPVLPHTKITQGLLQTNDALHL